MSIKVALKQGLCVPPQGDARVAMRRGLVYLGIGPKTVEMTTPVAVKAGFDMVKLAGDALPVEFIVLSVNGEAIELPADTARQVGAALLRKSDDADDYQLRVVK